MKYIIIGGVAGGATTAARLRRNDEFAEIILIEKGKYISYANCGLPYYIGNVIEDREKLFLQTPTSFAKRFNVDVRVENEVIGIDCENRKITIEKHNGQKYTETYDKLVLSPGASPIFPPLKGINSEGIFTLRNVEDTDRIKNYIASNKINKAIIVGAGFIGLEMAENLQHAGANVSIVEMDHQVMSPIDFSSAAIVHQHLIQKGVEMHLGTVVEGFEHTGSKIKVFLKNENTISGDIVILSIGVKPNVHLAKEAGLELGTTGGIKVNKYLQTSNENIYAVGDAIEFPHPITGKPWLNYLAGPANRQGRIAADNIVFGNKTEYEGSIGTAIAKVFDLTVATTGLPAKRLKQAGINYKSSTTHSGSHAGYYPGAIPLTTKLTFDPETGKIYGAQCIGYTGVDKRIDQIALVIKNGGTVNDLTRIEHAYAPPYSSAKDPVAVAGYVASNIVSGAMPVIYWRDMQNADRNNILIIDVRTADEYAMGSIGSAINIPVDNLRARISEIPKDKEIYVYCAIGLRGYLATKILMPNGYNVKNLSGGYKTYSTVTAPVKTSIKPLVNKNNEDIDLQNMKEKIEAIKIDACGLQCPGPILKLKKNMDNLSSGQRVEIISTDAGFTRDVDACCKSTGNSLISVADNAGKFTAVIEKNTQLACCSTENSCAGNKTLILFSDDLDKALATFVLANGAAATGGKVSIFFTFWGLNAIKKVKKPKTEKDLFGKMFSMMLPSSSLKLKLSKMNMWGVGSKMMRYIMKNKGIDSLESLRTQAIENGVEFIACQMSMDVMGVNREELLDNVVIGGVATYMQRADSANINLFI